MNSNYTIKEIDFNKITKEELKTLESYERKLDDTQTKLDYITKLLLKAYETPIEKELENYKLTNSKLFFLYNNNIIIGFGLCAPVKHIAGFYNIHQVYIEPEYRGQKLGQFLINQMIKILKEKYKANLIGIEAINKNTIATKLYQQLGFKPVTTYYRKEL